MPPRVKVTKEDIVKAAVDIVRKSGAQAINARTIASVLNCSTQPVFSNFATMDELRLAVAKKADILCQEYMQREVESGEFPTYKANGMAYICVIDQMKQFPKGQNSPTKWRLLFTITQALKVRMRSCSIWKCGRMFTVSQQ